LADSALALGSMWDVKDASQAQRPEYLQGG
jgi:hypothetical protein